MNQQHPQNPAYGQQPPQTAYAADPNAGTDLIAYSIPDEADYDDSERRGSGARKFFRPGGKKPDYPGVYDFVLRGCPVPQGRRAKKKIFKHLYQLANGVYFSHLCPIEMGVTGCRCLSCEKRGEMMSRNPLDDTLAKKLRPEEWHLMNVILRHDEARGPVMHEAHWSFDKLGKELRGQGVDPFDPSGNGIDLDLHVPRPSSGERWAYKPRVQRLPLHPDPRQVSEWIQSTHDLDLASAILSYDQQREAYEKALAGDARTDFPGAAAQQTAPRQAAYVQSSPAAPPYSQQSARPALPAGPPAPYGQRRGP